MAELTNCKTCGKEVSKTAPSCPHCGENFPGLLIKCEKCNSTDIVTDRKGFSFGKAGVGAVIFLPLGLLGMAGRKKTMFLCQSCGHRWIPA